MKGFRGIELRHMKAGSHPRLTGQGAAEKSCRHWALNTFAKTPVRRFIRETLSLNIELCIPDNSSVKICLATGSTEIA
jgi:hypothetical protein